VPHLLSTDAWPVNASKHNTQGRFSTILLLQQQQLADSLKFPHCGHHAVQPQRTAAPHVLQLKFKPMPMALQLLYLVWALVPVLQDQQQGWGLLLLQLLGKAG
jgi:hypothetical protein